MGQSRGGSRFLSVFLPDVLFHKRLQKVFSLSPNNDDSFPCHKTRLNYSTTSCLHADIEAAQQKIFDLNERPQTVLLLYSSAIHTSFGLL